MLSNMQFTAMMVMVLLTMVLAVLPQRVARNHVADHSRWLMAAATGLLALQFALQYKLKLRSMGVTQAVTLNLPFFIIASMLLSIALLYLQRQGRIQRQEWMVGVATWVVTVALIAGAVLSDGQPVCRFPVEPGIRFYPLKLDQEALGPAFKYYLSRQHWMDASCPPLEKRLEEYVDKIKTELS